MRVTGIKLRETLRRWETRIAVATTQFPESLWQFPNDNRKLPLPRDLSQQIRDAAEAIASLQSAQQQYNLLNRIIVAKRDMSLAHAIKLLGYAGRFEKMWRLAATDTGKDKYSSRTNVRQQDDIYADRQVSLVDALRMAEEAAAYASDLRTAFASANGKEIDVDIDAKFFVLPSLILHDYKFDINPKQP